MKVITPILLVIIAALCLVQCKACADGTNAPARPLTPAEMGIFPPNTIITNIIVTNITPPAIKAKWPMRTTTNLVKGAWTNEMVDILIPIGEEKQKFFKPSGVATNDDHKL